VELDDEEIYVLKKRPAGIGSDEIEARLKIKKMNKSVEELHNKLIKRVEGLNINDISDLQDSSPITAFLDLYERCPNVDSQFNQFFSKQFGLFIQLIDKEIGLNEFSVEMEKLTYVVYEIIKIENDKSEDAECENRK